MNKKVENQKIIDKYLDWVNKPLPEIKTKILGRKVLIELFYYHEASSKFVDAEGKPLAKGESKLYPKGKVLAVGVLGDDYPIKPGDIVNIQDTLVSTQPNPDWQMWRHHCQEDPQYAQNYEEPAKYVLNLKNFSDKFYQIDKFSDSVKPEEAFRLLLEERYILTKDED